MTREKPINIVKMIAEEHAPSVMARLELDNNEENFIDVLALALNSMQPKYVTTAEGEQYTKLINMYKAQYETDIVTALTRAVMQVKAKPRTIKRSSWESRRR